MFVQVELHLVLGVESFSILFLMQAFTPTYPGSYTTYHSLRAENFGTSALYRRSNLKTRYCETIAAIDWNVMIGEVNVTYHHFFLDPHGDDEKDAFFAKQTEIRLGYVRSTANLEISRPFSKFGYRHAHPRGVL